MSTKPKPPQLRLPVVNTDIIPEVPGVTQYQIVYGSHAHGTNTATSDVDTRGVFLLPNSAFLGLDRAQTTWENKTTDTVFWELGHFIQLLCKGNPNIVGMLYVPNDSVGIRSTIIANLLDMRDMFLTQEFRQAYMGWIHRESRDIGNLHKGHAKRLSHIPRLIWELESVYRYHTMVVRPTADKRAIVKAIKTGEMDYDEAMAYVGNLIIELEALDTLEGERLPMTDRKRANQWLLDMRAQYGGR